jgi:hypothetical protein
VADALRYNNNNNDIARVLRAFFRKKRDRRIKTQQTKKSGKK